MNQPTRALRISWIGIALVLAISHAAMFLTMRFLLATYEPDPNGFRLDDPTEVFWFLALTTPPLVIAVMAPSRVSFAFAAVAHAASPLALVPTMRAPGGDLNFAVFVWWFYLPAIMAMAFLLETWWRNHRSDREQTNS